MAAPGWPVERRSAIPETPMSDLQVTLSEVLANRFASNHARIRELAMPMSETQFWTKPFPYGNSFGHLVLHLTGNLNYYIGAQIANTGYVRDREREFTQADPPSRDEALKGLDSAVGMVIETMHAQSSEDWSKAYSAVGTSCSARLDIVLQCVAHMQHHIGQMVYIGCEWQRQAGQ